MLDGYIDIYQRRVCLCVCVCVCVKRGRLGYSQLNLVCLRVRVCLFVCSFIYFDLTTLKLRLGIGCGGLTTSSRKNKLVTETTTTITTTTRGSWIADLIQTLGIMVTSDQRTGPCGGTLSL